MDRWFYSAGSLLGKNLISEYLLLFSFIYSYHAFMNSPNKFRSMVPIILGFDNLVL
jgi:hypothetical protein